MTAYSASKGLNETTQEESFFERWLIMPKVLYFMLNMFVYAFHGVMGPLFKAWGFENFRYAFCTSIIATNFFGAMLWSTLADKTGRYKIIIILTATIYTAISVPMALYKAPEKELIQSWDYIKVFIGFGFWNFFLSAAFPLLDAQILGKLSKNPKLSKSQFTNQRAFGAIGHFIATLISFMTHGNPKGTVIFGVTTGIIFIVVVFFGIEDMKVAKGGHHHGGDKKGQSEGVAPARNPIKTLMMNPNFLFFMLFVAGMGVVRSNTSNFQKLIALDLTKPDPSSYTSKVVAWFKDTLSIELSEKNLKTAMVDFGRMLSEIFVYAYAKQMIGALGIYWIMVGSQLVGILRMGLYGMLDKDSDYAYYATWGLELMKGFSSGMISASAIPIASRIAPAGCESTAQGLYSGMYSGLSNLIAGVSSGLVLYAMFDPTDPTKEARDIQSMFLWSSLVTLIITVLMAAKFVFVDRVMGLPGFPRRPSATH